MQHNKPFIGALVFGVVCAALVVTVAVGFMMNKDNPSESKAVTPLTAVSSAAEDSLKINIRDTNVKDKVALILTEVTNYTANNNGKLPSTAAEQASFMSKYLAGIDLNDPRSENPLKVVFTDSTNGKPVALPKAQTSAREATVIIGTNNGFQCQGSELAEAISARQFAVTARLENNTNYCLDNQ